MVAVKAAGINPGETNIRTRILDHRFPATPPPGQGSDLTGVARLILQPLRERDVRVRGIASAGSENVAAELGAIPIRFSEGIATHQKSSDCD